MISPPYHIYNSYMHLLDILCFIELQQKNGQIVEATVDIFVFLLV